MISIRFMCTDHYHNNCLTGLHKKLEIYRQIVKQWNSETIKYYLDSCPGASPSKSWKTLKSPPKNSEGTRCYIYTVNKTKYWWRDSSLISQYNHKRRLSDRSNHWQWNEMFFSSFSTEWMCSGLWKNTVNLICSLWACRIVTLTCTPDKWPCELWSLWRMMMLEMLGMSLDHS